MFVYVLNNHCHRVTTQLQLINIIIIIIIKMDVQEVGGGRGDWIVR
jgi:hypothetical protein